MKRKKNGGGTMRCFKIKAEDADGTTIMTPITVEIPDTYALSVPDAHSGSGRRVDSYALAEALRQVVGELARYGLSECILAGEGSIPSKVPTQTQEETSVMTEEDAEKLGFDAGLNGPNTRNSNFRIFASPKTRDAWERGYVAARPKHPSAVAGVTD
jgi:hypothetical protein